MNDIACCISIHNASGRVHLGVVMMALLLPARLLAEPLTVYTEEFPPYNFTRDGTVQGVSTQVVEAALERAGFDYQLKSLPWARSFKRAQIENNTLIYSITRNQERESKFQWIGVVSPAIHSVFALQTRDDIRLANLADLKHYRIGTQLAGARESYLLQNGFSEDALLRLSGDRVLIQQYRMLTLGRIDLWPAADAVAYYVVRAQGDDPEQVLRKVYEFEQLSRDGYYLAASLATTAALRGWLGSGSLSGLAGLLSLVPALLSIAGLHTGIHRPASRVTRKQDRCQRGSTRRNPSN